MDDFPLVASLPTFNSAFIHPYICYICFKFRRLCPWVQGCYLFLLSVLLYFSLNSFKIYSKSGFVAPLFVCLFPLLQPQGLCLYQYLSKYMLYKHFPLFLSFIFNTELFSFILFIQFQLFLILLFSSIIFYHALLIPFILLKCLRNDQLPNLQIQ